MRILKDTAGVLVWEKVDSANSQLRSAHGAATITPHLNYSQFAYNVVMELSEGWLETILKRDALERSVSRVVSVEKEDVVIKGDNIASDIARLKMKTVLGSGRMATRSLIMKTAPTAELRAKQIGEWGLFRKEIKIYNTVLPKMDELMDSVGYTGETLWGRCFYTRPNDTIILEDLKELGFKMVDRKEGLDVNHVLLALRNLGKYHALSAVLKERGTLDVAGFKDTIFSANLDSMEQYVEQVLTQFAEVVDTTWGEEWKVYVPKIKSLVGRSMDVINQLFDEKCDFPVLNHGDFWVNNIMFKYDGDSNIPSGIRFIDFQMSYYNSYAFDLMCFLTTSVRPEIREKDYGPFLQEYHTSLTWHLSRLGYAGDNVPSLEDVKQEVKNRSVYIIILTCMMLTFVFAESDETPDIEEMLKSHAKTNTVRVDPKPMLGRKYTRAAKSIIRFCQSQGTFDKL
ncbi:hypothetical protein AAG570_000667 [Ranatra chinensis]|uniref:CHK kinase-like domain-containing protein n=1 Tax=Ranatra chinensis TaxID=642074 RepID=A0ABD0ZAE6_9HEMI